jgi:hypothetical protein
VQAEDSDARIDSLTASIGSVAGCAREMAQLAGAVLSERDERTVRMDRAVTGIRGAADFIAASMGKAQQHLGLGGSTADHADHHATAAASESASASGFFGDPGHYSAAAPMSARSNAQLSFGSPRRGGGGHTARDTADEMARAVAALRDIVDRDLALALVREAGDEDPHAKFAAMTHRLDAALVAAGLQQVSAGAHGTSSVSHDLSRSPTASPSHNNRSSSRVSRTGGGGSGGRSIRSDGSARGGSTPNTTVGGQKNPKHPEDGAISEEGSRFGAYIYIF